MLAGISLPEIVTMAVGIITTVAGLWSIRRRATHDDVMEAGARLIAAEKRATTAATERDAAIEKARVCQDRCYELEGEKIMLERRVNRLLDQIDKLSS